MLPPALIAVVMIATAPVVMVATAVVPKHFKPEAEVAFLEIFVNLLARWAA